MHTSISSSNDKATIDTSTFASNGFATQVAPTQQNQIWKFSASQTDRRAYGGGASFTITSLTGSGDNLAGTNPNSWRVFQLPSTSAKQDNEYVLYNEIDGNFLSFDAYSRKVSLSKSLALDTLIINSISTSAAGTEPGPDVSCLLWKLSPSTSLLEEGIYQFIWPDSQIERCITRGRGTNVAPVLASVNQSDGFQFWNVSLQVSNVGDVFYDIRNYVSGELLQSNKVQFTVSAANGVSRTEFQITSDGRSGLLSISGDDLNCIGVDNLQNLVVQPRDKPAAWKLNLGLPKLAVAPCLPPSLPNTLTTKSWDKISTNTSFPVDSSQSQAFSPFHGGIYRVVNESTGRIACLTISHANSGPVRSIAMTDGQSSFQSTDEQIWCLKRLSGYQGVIYQFISYYDSALIAEQSLDTAAGSDSHDCFPAQQDESQPSQLWTIEPQSNFSYAIKSYQTGFLLEDCGTLKSTPLVDIPRAAQRWKVVPAPSPITPGMYRLRFQTGDYLQASAVGSADRSLACRIASRVNGTNSVEVATPTGLYFFGCDTQGQPVLTERCQEYSEFKFLSTGDEAPGFYVQHFQTNMTVTFGPPNQISALNSHDDLKVKLNVTAFFGTRRLGSPGQIVTLEAPPAQVSSISSNFTNPTFTPQEGLYTMVSSRHTYLCLTDLVHLAPPSIPRSKYQASAVNPPSGTQMRQTQWAIQSTGNGYYTISCSNFFLCQASSIVESACWPYSNNYPASVGQTFPVSQDAWSPNDVVGTIPSYDAARWKFMSIDGQKFNVINRSTGNLLQVDSPGYTISARPDTPFPSLASFTLIRLGDLSSLAVPRYLKPAPLIDKVTLQAGDNSTAGSISRELGIDSGVFMLSLDSVPGTARCLALSDVDALSNLNPLDVTLKSVDLEPYSLDSGLQHWKVEKNDEGWYLIQHYLYGFFLSAVFKIQGGKRVYPSSPPSVGLYSAQYASTWSEKAIFHWKFIEVDQRVCLINRACDDYCLISDGSSCKFAHPSDDQPYW